MKGIIVEKVYFSDLDEGTYAILQETKEELISSGVVNCIPDSIWNDKDNIGVIVGYFGQIVQVNKIIDKYKIIEDLSD